ncbi:fimbrial protein [Stenotrophomonas maltophilia]|uniref:fimbrial protein n=1 Tax=Stenotrophomonas maltophilia TaxID=40324 RepID=UPI00131101AB
MNKLAIALSAALSLGAAGSASAADATITFNGTLTALTCSIGAGSATGTTVTLPNVSPSVVNSGLPQRQAAFNLVMGAAGSECTAGNVTLNFNGSALSGRGYLTNTGSATNLELAILNGGTAMDLSTDTLTATFTGTDTKTWPLVASYEKSTTGDATAGSFVGSLVIDVTF